MKAKRIVEPVQFPVDFCELCVAPATHTLIFAGIHVNICLNCLSQLFYEIEGELRAPIE